MTCTKNTFARRASLTFVCCVRRRREGRESLFTACCVRGVVVLQVFSESLPRNYGRHVFSCRRSSRFRLSSNTCGFLPPYIHVTLDNTVRKPGKVLCIPDRFLWWQATQNVTGPFPWYIATVGCGGKEEIDNLAQLVLVPFIRSHWVVCVQTFWSSLTTLHVI